MNDTFENGAQEYLRGRMALMKHHEVFSRVKTLDNLRTFMEWHVFAVWDFMSLVKRLQNDFTCTGFPWVPKAGHRASRLINEIVLGEETDETPDGAHLSHYELYLAAMTEVGASIEKITAFVALVRDGATVQNALREIEAPLAVQRFVNSTLHTVERGKTHEILGSFFYGREDVIPEMFRSLLKAWAIPDSAAPKFRYYLDRHIELDGDNHGPAVEAIIREVVGDDARQLAELESAALSAVEERIALWNALGEHLSGAHKHGVVAHHPGLVKTKNSELFELLSNTVISDEYLDEGATVELHDQFAVNGYVKLPNFFTKRVAALIKQQLEAVQPRSLRRDFLMPGYGTPRKLSVVGGARILDECLPLAMLYCNDELRAVLAKITGKKLYSVRHVEEFTVANFLVDEADTHGWHLDDPQYALIMVTEAPEPHEGGLVEFVSDWQRFCELRELNPRGDLERAVQRARSEGVVHQHHHAAGECYLLNAGANLHRVTPIAGSGTRRAMNMAFDDRRQRKYGDTATFLYGHEAHV